MRHALGCLCLVAACAAPSSPAAVPDPAPVAADPQPPDLQPPIPIEHHPCTGDITPRLRSAAPADRKHVRLRAGTPLRLLPEGTSDLRVPLDLHAEILARCDDVYRVLISEPELDYAAYVGVDELLLALVADTEAELGGDESFLLIYSGERAEVISTRDGMSHIRVSSLYNRSFVRADVPEDAIGLEFDLDHQGNRPLPGGRWDQDGPYSMYAYPGADEPFYESPGYDIIDRFEGVQNGHQLVEVVTFVGIARGWVPVDQLDDDGAGASAGGVPGEVLADVLGGVRAGAPGPAAEPAPLEPVRAGTLLYDIDQRSIVGVVHQGVDVVVDRSEGEWDYMSFDTYFGTARFAMKRGPTR